MFTKSKKVAKLFFTITFSGLIMYIILAFYSLHRAYQQDTDTRRQRDLDRVSPRFDQDLKYILIESKSPETVPFLEGQKLFIDYQCPQFNCYLTTNERLLKSRSEFDAVLINVTELPDMFPMSRPKKQLYIFYGMEPSDQLPICNPDADNFFNYTWSYKLSSDIVSPFFTVSDVNGSTVAPSLHVQWTMAIPKSSLKREEVVTLKYKSKAVAMVVRSCRDNDGRIFAKRLKEALKVHSQELNIFGCGDQFPLPSSDALIAKKYYFVLVTTGGAAQDYVTDKVLKAYWNSAVPIVKARADLTKFLPPGSYVNAHLQTPEQIAAIVHYSIQNPSVYRMFFKWRNFYRFHKRQEFDGVCELCSLLNGGPLFSNSSANLREWWDSSSATKVKCGPK